MLLLCYACIAVVMVFSDVFKMMLYRCQRRLT